MIDGQALAEVEGWGPPFSVGEYRDRVEKVRGEMARREIDVLLVSSPPNITYLTGYDMIWYYLTSPVSVAVHADSGQTLFFEVPYHKPTVEWHAVVDDAEYFGDGQTAAEHIVSSLKGRGWLKGNVGVEDWSRAPSGVVINEINQGFADASANVVDSSWVVDRVRLIKSAPEIEVMRQAASIADKAMETVHGHIRSLVGDCPTRLDEIKNFHAEVHLGTLGFACWQPAKMGHIETREIRGWMEVA